MLLFNLLIRFLQENTNIKYKRKNIKGALVKIYNNDEIFYFRWSYSLQITWKMLIAIGKY